MRTTLVINDRECAVNNAVARQVLDAWQNSGAACGDVTLRGFPPSHDILDPSTFPANARYPELERMLLG